MCVDLVYQLESLVYDIRRLCAQDFLFFDFFEYLRCFELFMLKIQKPLSLHSCCCNNLAVVVVIREIVVIHPDLFCEVQLTLTQNTVEIG